MYIIYSIFKSFGIFDPTYHGIMRALYDHSNDKYGREVPHDSAVTITDAVTIADAVTTTTASPNSPNSSVDGSDILGPWTQFVPTLIIILIN